MAKQTKLILVMLICSACDMTRVYYPVDIENEYFDSIFIESCIIKEDSLMECSFIHNNKFDLGDKDGKGFIYSPTDRLNFYQDKDKLCYLYSYSKEDLLELKTNAGFSPSSRNATFITDKNKLTVVKKNQHKSNFQSHPYDSSLCKPMPTITQDLMQ